MLKRITLFLIAIIVLVTGSFFFGPKPTYENVNNTPIDSSFDITTLEKMLSDREGVVQYLKPDNEARIVWAERIPNKTKYSIVYLHGFSASQGEGFPMHLNIADSLNANLYLPRLPEHGIDNKDAMKNLTPKMLVESGKEAIAIGKAIGEKVIVVGCSTGGTLGIFLAAGDPKIEALILLSPNIEVKSGGSKMLTGPWGKELAYQVVGEHREFNRNGESGQYWSERYHTNGVIAMQSLLDQTMTKDIFDDLALPIYCGYYYKNEELQDQVVSVEAMLEFRDALSIPEEDREFEAFKKGNHVLGSVYKNENWQQVEMEVLDFIKREVL